MMNNVNQHNSIAFPSIYCQQSKITFLPKQNYKKDEQRQLQVGLDLKEFGLIPSQKLQQRRQSPQQKFIDEFPAYYLDLLPLPPFLYKEQNQVNYCVLEKQRERNQQNSAIKLPLLKLGQQVETLQKLNSQKTQKNTSQNSVTQLGSIISDKPNIQSVKSKSHIDLKQKSSRQSFQKQEKNKRQIFNPSPLLKRLINKVKQLIIQISFFQLLVDTLNQKIPQIKSQQREEFKENQDGASKQLYEWLDESLDKFLLELTNYNQLLNLKIGEDKSNAQKKKKIQELLNLLMRGIEEVSLEKHFTKQLALLLNRVTQSYQFAPLAYYFKFEIMRIKPTVFGSIGLMEQNQQRMVLLLFLFIRQILFSQILITWQFHPIQDENNQQLGIIQTNSIILISILHEIIIKWIEKNVRKIRTLDLDLLKVQFQYLEKPLTMDLKKMEQQGKVYQENQLIDGIMSSTGIQKYLYNQNGELDDYAKKLENDMIKIVDKVQEQLNDQFTQQNLQKDRIVKLMSIYFSKTLFK